MPAGDPPNYNSLGGATNDAPDRHETSYELITSDGTRVTVYGPGSSATGLDSSDLYRPRTSAREILGIDGPERHVMVPDPDEEPDNIMPAILTPFWEPITTPGSNEVVLGTMTYRAPVGELWSVGQYVASGPDGISLVATDHRNEAFGRIDAIEVTSTGLTLLIVLIGERLTTSTQLIDPQIWTPTTGVPREKKIEVDPEIVGDMEMDKPCEKCNEHICKCVDQEINSSPIDWSTLERNYNSDPRISGSSRYGEPATSYPGPNIYRTNT